jgi:DNA invertase Pin-like site-specific DNA recombinase
MVSELLLNEARKQGVKIFEAASGQEMTNDDDPTRVLLRQFLGAISQWDKSNMVKRLAAARARLKAKGGFMGGKIPWEEKHPVAAEHIISLRKTGYTIDEIRNFMREHGFRTPDGGKPNQWQNSTIHLIVTRLITKGKLPPLEKKQAVLDHITI